jgi:hypothetical protein
VTTILHGQSIISKACARVLTELYRSMIFQQWFKNEEVLSLQFETSPSFFLLLLNDNVTVYSGEIPRSRLRLRGMT